MSEGTEIAIKIALTGAALVALVAFRLGSLRRRRGVATLVAGSFAALAIAAYYNFGSFHGPDVRQPGMRFVHYHEQFHYQLGSKYFPELGYDGLYAASLAAERERFPLRRTQSRTRDLRSNRLVPTRSLARYIESVRARFEPERWREFVRDNASFLEANLPGSVARWRRDVGYNPTPAWTFVGRLLNAYVPLTRRGLEILGAVDVVLLGVMFAVVFRTYGAAVGCASLVLFGLGYLGRFDWIGGAYLRLDWLVAVVLGICALERGRGASAGALFGYATAVRLFPALFLVGPAVSAARSLWRGERPRWALSLAVGFASTLAVGFAAGCFTGRGPAAWSEFWGRIEVYRFTGARNLIGLESVVLFPTEIGARAMGGEEDEPWVLDTEDVVLRRYARRPLLFAAQGLLLLLLLAAAWRATPADAAVLSMLAVFALTPAAGYYWVVLLAVPLRGGWAALAGALLLTLVMYAAHWLIPDTLVRYGVLSAALLVFLVAWALPDAVRTLRGAGAAPRRRLDFTRA